MVDLHGELHIFDGATADGAARGAYSESTPQPPEHSLSATPAPTLPEPWTLDSMDPWRASHPLGMTVTLEDCTVLRVPDDMLPKQALVDEARRVGLALLEIKHAKLAEGPEPWDL